MTSSGPHRRKKARRSEEAMSLADAYTVLGLAPAADHGEVHATYRRLALLHHPDRNPGDRNSLERFKQLAAAYRVLLGKHRADADKAGEIHGECDRCGEYSVLYAALDGTQCCSACLSQANRRRMLPAPPIVIASCATTVVLLVMAVSLLVAGCVSVAPTTRLYAMASLALGLSALLSLAVTCGTVIYTAEPQRLQRQPKRPLARVHRGE